MLSLVPETISQNIVKLIPASIVNEISSFVFYDNHPRDPINIDITICTTSGELKEYYKREELFSISLPIIKPSEIRILRNSKCELFYLVAAEDKLVIVSRKEKLHVHQEVSNIDYYEIDDLVSRGQACLKIVRKDDAVPLVFDDNFENLGDRALLMSSIHADDSLPILTQLMRKLTEAKYSVKCNEKTLKDFLNLRQLSAFYSYQKIHPNLDDAVFNLKQNAADCLKIKTETPWIKLCNQKIVIVLNIINKNTLPVEDVHILLHGSSRPSLVYTTKLFEKAAFSPFWTENETNHIKSNNETAVVAVIPLKEVKDNVTNKIEFNGVLFFKMDSKENMVPFEDVLVTTMDMMSGQLDVLSESQIGDPNTILAILATSEQRKLILRHIKKEEDPYLQLQHLFCKHLQMVPLPNINNIVIHRSSPYHLLNGVMVVFEDSVKPEKNGTTFELIVYTRTSSQLLNLIHYIHEAIPYRIIATTPNLKITAKTQDLNKYNEEIAEKSITSIDCEGYASSIVKQSAIMLDYFDSCIVKMNESKEPSVRNKIGSEIDLFAGGVTSYVEFKKKMLEEASRGIKSLGAMESEESIEHPEYMIVDNP